MYNHLPFEIQADNFDVTIALNDKHKRKSFIMVSISSIFFFVHDRCKMLRQQSAFCKDQACYNSFCHGHLTDLFRIVFVRPAGNPETNITDQPVDKYIRWDQIPKFPFQQSKPKSNCICIKVNCSFYRAVCYITCNK